MLVSRPTQIFRSFLTNSAAHGTSDKNQQQFAWVLAACGARVNRGQQVHYLYPGDSAYLAACEENAALPCVVLGTNDMTQNTLELAAFDRVFLLDAEDAQGVAPALEALGEEPDGFILFERYHDEANIETVLRTTGLERAERLFEHQYQVYWVH